MMTHVYSEIYLQDAAETLGAMMDFGSNALDAGPVETYRRFIKSGIADEFANGNPKYLAGKSGTELALESFEATGKPISAFPQDYMIYYGPEYWAGWAVAQLQWATGKSFRQLENGPMSIQRILRMYHPYHEADISKFIRDAKMILESAPNPLKRKRKLCHMTQIELAESSGVSLRMIRSYEQNYNSFLTAGFGSVSKLTEALHCKAEDLLK